uniref:Uncharacterized protein n=1 Tax=Acrobeloides nanus TaxID=290746 RepID=A0A914CDT9_9BILA
MKKLLESLKEVEIFAEPYLGRRSIINILQYKKSFVNSDNKKTIKLIIPINDDYKNNTLTLKIKTQEFGGERYKWNYIRVPAEGISLFYKMVEEFLSFHDDIEESATPSGDILESGDTTNRNENISIAQKPLTELNRIKGISHVKKQPYLFKRLYKVHKFTIGQKAYYLNLAQLNNDNENDIIVQINEIDKEKPHQKPKPLWLNRQSNKLLTYKETLLDREREMNLILELLPYKLNSYAINLCSFNIYNKVILNFFIPFEGIDQLQEKLGYLFGYYDTFNQLNNQIEIFDDDGGDKTINKASNNSPAIKLKDRLEKFTTKQKRPKKS